VPSHLALISTLPPHHGPLSEYGELLVRGLTPLGYRISVLADRIPGQRPLPEAGLPCQVQRCWQANDLRSLWQIARAVQNLQPDMVLCNLHLGSFGPHWLPAALGLWLPRLLRRQQLPVVVLLHNLLEALDLRQPCFAQNPWQAALLKWGATTMTRQLLAADKIIVTSERHRQLLQSHYAAERLRVIGLGAMLPPAQAVNLPASPRLLSFGKFGTYKRLERLLQVFSRLRTRYPSLELWIGGGDHPATPGYLQALSQQHLQTPGLRWLGWIPQSELPAMLQSITALVLDYDATTGSSGPLHLAASQGKVTLAPALPDFVAARDEGLDLLSYAPRCAVALEQVLEQVLNGQVPLQAMGKDLLSWAQQTRLEATAAQYHEVLQQVLGTCSLPAAELVRSLPS